VSVTIATKDRAHELESICLPSLASQDTRDFEVIIWDASEDESCEEAVRRFALEHPGLSIRYFRALRVGSCAQRNDAVKVARGEVIFFIDDDCEVSPHGLAALSSGFQQNPSASGGALVLEEASSGTQTRWTRLRSKYYDPIFGLRPCGSRPGIRPSGSWLDSQSEAGEVDHLIGCDMAFRKSVFLQHSFNERMQRFAPYALWEDTEFSHRVWRHGNRLFVFEGGSVTHRRVGGDRTSRPEAQHAQYVYNRYMVWRYAIFPFRRLSLVPYSWSVAGESAYRLAQFLKDPMNRGDYLTGALRGYWAAIRDFAASR
jgi:glycosyltransferase involved in cell wall biosynthesis